MSDDLILNGWPIPEERDTCPSCGVVGEHECDPKDVEQNRAIGEAVEGIDGDE